MWEYISLCLSGKLLNSFSNLRLKDVLMVSPDILLASVPVGAVRIINGLSGWGLSVVRIKCSAHNVRMLMSNEFPVPSPPWTISNGG